MNRDFITFRSITPAQQAQRILRRAGLDAAISQRAESQGRVVDIRCHKAVTEFIPLYQIRQTELIQ